MKKPHDWRKEICACKHRRDLHEDLFGGLAKGHECCLKLGCACVKYTWKAPKKKGGKRR